MAVTKNCANQIHSGIRAGKSNEEIADKVGVQKQTVADFRAGRDTARTTIRKS